MSQQSADWRAARDRMSERMASELERPDGKASEQAKRLARWLARHDVADEDRATFTRMVMMTMSLPEEVQPAYAADMISEIEGWDGPDAPVEIFRWFREPSPWATAQAQRIVTEEIKRARPARPSGANWADRELADEERGVIRTIAGVLETNAARAERDGWTKQEADGAATSLLGLLTVERVCDFVGHLTGPSQPEIIAEDELDKWADRMAEAVNRMIVGPGDGHGLAITTTVICMAWVNWTRVFLEEGAQSNCQELLGSGSRWVAVYQNLPHAGR